MMTKSTRQYVAKLEDQSRAAERIRSAAPEMLKALKKCVHWMETYSPALCSDSLASARAAIAKAEGRE